MLDQFAALESKFSSTVWNILVVILAILLGLLIKASVHWVFSFYTKKSDYYVFKSITKHLQTPASILIPL
ncbi:MAG TPA: hypothetical protein VF473_08635, partial [Cyclobacteriaceae bacterium]